MDINEQIAELKTQVQTTVDQLLAIIEKRKQDIFNIVDNQAKKPLESLSQNQVQVANQMKLIESAIEETEFVLKRSFSIEILEFSETFDSIL